MIPARETAWIHGLAQFPRVSVMHHGLSPPRPLQQVVEAHAEERRQLRASDGRRGLD